MLSSQSVRFFIYGCVTAILVCIFSSAVADLTATCLIVYSCIDVPVNTLINKKTYLFCFFFQLWINTYFYLLMFVAIAAHSSEIGNPITDDIEKISILVSNLIFK